ASSALHQKLLKINDIHGNRFGPPFALRQSSHRLASFQAKGKRKRMKLEIPHKTNGVDTARMQETVRTVKASPELGRFKFRIENRWLGAGANRSEVRSFDGCGQTLSHSSSFTLAADEPDMLLGNDTGANPVEHLLHALASCVTTSMVYHAAARGIAVEEVESS